MIKIKRWFFSDISNKMHTLKLGALYFPEPGVCYFTAAKIQDAHDHFK